MKREIKNKKFKFFNWVILVVAFALTGVMFFIGIILAFIIGPFALIFVPGFYLFSFEKLFSPIVIYPLAILIQFVYYYLIISLILFIKYKKSK